MEERLLTLTKENKFINRPSAGKNSYFTLSDDKSTMETKDNNDRLNNIMKETNDLKLSIETYQNITDDKLKDTENAIDKIKETFKREIEKLKKDIDDNNNKLRILEDRSRPDNLGFDDIEEWEEESWADTEQNLKETLSDILGIQNVKIERAHRVGDKKRSACRTIVAKLSSFKMKEHILAEAKKRKLKGIQIYEDFSKATVEKRKKNWEKVKELRAQNKYAILVYDKMYIIG